MSIHVYVHSRKVESLSREAAERQHWKVTGRADEGDEQTQVTRVQGGKYEQSVMMYMHDNVTANDAHVCKLSSWEVESGGLSQLCSNLKSA